MTKENTDTKAHFVRENRTGYFITDVDLDQPVFKTFEEAMIWANSKGIIVTRER